MEISLTLILIEKVGLSYQFVCGITNIYDTTFYNHESLHGSNKFIKNLEFFFVYFCSEVIVCKTEERKNEQFEL